MESQKQKSGVSKKASVALAALAVIGASDDIKVIIGAVILGLGTVIVQGVLDWKSE